MVVVTMPPDVEALPDRIAEMLEGQTVFITGGTGFLGKILIEKILRRCSGVKTIYLLVRNKKGKTPHERVDDIFKNMLFDTLREQNPLAFKKCKPIPGDVTQVDLGIPQDYRKILQDQVDFIFHSAASTRFDETVRVAARINTRGTKYMLDLAKECKKLKVLVHVSTAYAHPHETVLEEKAYQPPADPNVILKTIDFDREDDSEEREHLKLLDKCPNTYTFTKALAEDLVVQEMERLPAIVVRPSIVCPIWREPFPGWCNNLQGPMGLFVGAGKGVIRSMYMNGENKSDFITADIVINCLLGAAWVFLNHDKSQRFYNVTSSTKYAVKWKEIIELGKHVVTHHVPFNGIVWYPGGSLKNSKFVHNICFYLFQIVPALFIDLLLLVLGYKPVLYQIQRRIQKGSEMLEYFTTKQWEFTNVKAMGIANYMNSKEREIYKLDAGGFVILEYFKDCMLGLRRHNLKETDDMLPAARRNIKIMWFVDVVFKALFLMGVLYYSYKWFLQPIFRV